MTFVEGHFYFLNDEYFAAFPDKNIMTNKEKQGNQEHNRPCFFAFRDTDSELLWLIPISSKVEKYRGIYDHKKEKYGSCDTIVFCDVLGDERAFLIQNMCPATEAYIKNEYLQPSGDPVEVDGVSYAEIIRKAKRTLSRYRRGIKAIFPDIIEIENRLKNGE